MKILILGYSNIVRRRVLKNLIKKNYKIYVATKSYENQIPGIKKKYKSYENAIKDCKPNLVFVSLPNSKHFFWAQKSLQSNCHTIVDKPITSNYEELKKLIQLSNKKRKLLVEATYFNYHSQIKKTKKLFNQKEKKIIEASFTIPMPKKNSILLSKKLGGGVLMDMGPYISSIPRLFKLTKVISKTISIRKNKKKLIISIKFVIKFKEGLFKGKFAFGGQYTNRLVIKNSLKSVKLFRVFSPPDNEHLYLKYRYKTKSKKILIQKEDCFKNFLSEVQSKLKKKKFNYYFERMLSDCSFRANLLK